MTGRRQEMEGFADELEFLRRHTDVVVLQGKTMISGWAGSPSPGFGWINKSFIASRRDDIQANLHGGEDRLWIGPEGGQFTFFFDSGRPFDFSFWRVPPLIDRQAFEVVTSEPEVIELIARGRMRNYFGADFDIELGRRIEVLQRRHAEERLGRKIPDDVAVVGHGSVNRMRNVGERDWVPQSGLPCIWSMGMFRPTARTVMLLPFQASSTAGTPINSNYFGPLDERRLRLEPQRGLALFSGDGGYRSKLGVGFPRARPLLGSWTPEQGRLTIVEFNLPKEVEHGYCCNLWEEQQEPLGGDVVNVYNDGPNESGGCLGPFYELETLSPALGLKVGEAYEHEHRTIHLIGQRESLEDLARGLFEISLEEMEGTFG